MSTSASDKAFSGSIPGLYETYLVPLIFESYARDLAVRAAARAPERVLEIAAGTGVVTRAMASALSTATSIVATDLNQAMIDEAKRRGVGRPVTWRQADAMALPFPDQSFDAVVCQFGVMFFPDRPAAFREVHRVLRPAGVFLFNVWDRIEENDFANLVTSGVARVFPDDPPRFLPRAPYGYYDRGQIVSDLAAGGFRGSPEIVVLTERSRAPSPRHPAVGFVQGCPLKAEIESRDASKLEPATAAATEEIARRFGTGPVDGKIQALVVAVTR